jgi:branched-chain amino acid transport system permease protein
LFGGIILFLVLAFPEGLAGISRQIETLWQLYRPAVGVVRREKLT